MRSKFILTVAASLLAGTIAAGAQRAAPADERDRTGQPTDASATSTKPNRPGGTQAPSGTVGSGAPREQPRDDGRYPVAAGRHLAVGAPQGGAGGSDASRSAK